MKIDHFRKKGLFVEDIEKQKEPKESESIETDDNVLEVRDWKTTIEERLTNLESKHDNLIEFIKSKSIPVQLPLIKGKDWFSPYTEFALLECFRDHKGVNILATIIQKNHPEKELQQVRNRMSEVCRAHGIRRVNRKIKQNGI